MAQLSTIPILEPNMTMARNISPTKSKKQKQTVSASAIFKNRAVKSKIRNSAAGKTSPQHARAAKSPIRHGLKKRAALKHQPPASPSSPLGRKSHADEAKQAFDTSASTHPLSIRFNQSADTYRRVLLSHYSQSLTALHTSSLSKLHARNSIPIRTCSDSIQSLPYPEAHTLISAPLKYPLGSAILRVPALDADGKEVEIYHSLEDRMQNFMARTEEKEELMLKLKRDWEILVNEVYWVGAQVLGEGEMGLLMRGGDEEKGKEESLFVPEDEEMELAGLGICEVVDAKGKGKAKVSFEDQNESEDVVEFVPTRSLLKHPLKPVADLKNTWVKGMENEVQDLGQEALEQLMQLEKEDQRQWAVKQRKILSLLHE